MDTTIRASIRQFAALWYVTLLQEDGSHERATERAMMQAALYLSDFGIGQSASEDYLLAASEAISQVFHKSPKNN